MKKTTILTLLWAATALSAYSSRPLTISRTPTQGFKVCLGERVIAHGDTPCDTLNPGVRWWLNSIRQQPDIHRAPTVRPTELGFPDSCEPLLTTEWGQEAPYNWMCPLPDYSPWGGYLPDATHCPTGCVATATAQIMKHFRYPAHGEGTCSVNPEQLPGTTVYTVDLAEAHYDWDLMLDDYTTDYTEEQARAVAELSYHVGVASRMGYRDDASATDNNYALMALQQHFGYSNGIENIERNNYTESEWMQLVYTELSEGRPILYEAVGIDLGTYGIYGHSFVIDGYDADGLVHVNWGWYGNSNGYYDIALLNPRDLHFDAYQMMGIGIQPASHGDTAVDSPHSIGQRPAAADGVYTLDGRLLRQASSPSQLPPGIYLCNGRKHIVR
ncbi:MAG: C10 family peptidase [Prevotella sp.]|nr:C10 family peptidase [Prevotella sp.]